MRSGPIILRLQQGGGASSLVGAGLEFGLFDNWSAKVEYDYLDLGSKSVTLIGSQTFSNIPNPVVTNPIQRTFDIDQTFHVIKSAGQCPWAFSRPVGAFFGREREAPSGSVMATILCVVVSAPGAPLA